MKKTLLITLVGLSYSVYAQNLSHNPSVLASATTGIKVVEDSEKYKIDLLSNTKSVSAINGIYKMVQLPKTEGVTDDFIEVTARNFQFQRYAELRLTRVEPNGILSVTSCLTGHEDLSDTPAFNISYPQCKYITPQLCENIKESIGDQESFNQKAEQCKSFFDKVLGSLNSTLLQDEYAKGYDENLKIISQNAKSTLALKSVKNANKLFAVQRAQALTTISDAFEYISLCDELLGEDGLRETNLEFMTNKNEPKVKAKTKRK